MQISKVPMWKQNKTESFQSEKARKAKIVNAETALFILNKLVNKDSHFKWDTLYDKENLNEWGSQLSFNSSCKGLNVLFWPGWDWMSSYRNF